MPPPEFSIFCFFLHGLGIQYKVLPLPSLA